MIKQILTSLTLLHSIAPLSQNKLVEKYESREINQKYTQLRLYFEQGKKFPLTAVFVEKLAGKESQFIVEIDKSGQFIFHNPLTFTIEVYGKMRQVEGQIRFYNQKDQTYLVRTYSVKY